MEEVIATAVQEALQKLGITEVDFVVEHPNELSHGDYACNAALVCAKKAGQAPHTLAERIREALEDQIEYVEKIEVAGPGFLNFFLARDFFTEEIARINARAEDWGSADLLAGKQIMLEYTSPNLFKPLHIGNLVGNILGEALARLFATLGADVKRINYPSDIGLTVAKGVWGLQQTNGDPSDIVALGTAYKEGNDAYENDPQAKQEIDAVNKALYEGGNETLNALREAGLETSKARLAELCALLGTQFDTTIYESEAGPVGTQIVTEHIGDVFEKSEGAVVFKGEHYGLHTRVFLNSQGLPTYEAKDLGNFSLKQQAYPNWDASIVVTGSEQTEYFKVLYEAVRRVFDVPADKELHHVPNGFLTLTTGKMSSRKGNVLTGESMLQDLQDAARDRAQESRADDVDALAKVVAVAALKYQILKHTVGSNIVFDKEKALSFEGDSGPYLQYTYARIISVLGKATEAGVSASIAHAPETPYELEKMLYRFEEVLMKAAETYEVQEVVAYLTAIAGMFNTFYAREKIADPEDAYAPYKAALCLAVAHTLANGLRILGMQAPRSM